MDIVHNLFILWFAEVVSEVWPAKSLAWCRSLRSPMTRSLRWPPQVTAGPSSTSGPSIWPPGSTRTLLTWPRCTGSLTTRGIRSTGTRWLRREKPERRWGIVWWNRGARAAIRFLPDPGPQVAQPRGACAALCRHPVQTIQTGRCCVRRICDRQNCWILLKESGEEIAATMATAPGPLPQ